MEVTSKYYLILNYKLIKEEKFTESLAKDVDTSTDDSSSVDTHTVEEDSVDKE